jgi:hypothetical protein
VQAKFAEGWRHKRIEAELAKLDRAVMQRRIAGRSGGIKSGIARAVAQGEAIIRAQADGKRALARSASGREAGGPAELKQPRTNHNQRFESSSSPESSNPEIRNPEAAIPKVGNPRPANQWSRQELDALFARRSGFARRTGADTSDAPSNETSSKSETGG